MSLAIRLQNLKKASAKKIDADTRAVMEAAAEELAASGILDGVVREGEKR